MTDIQFELCGKQFTAAEITAPNSSSIWRYPEVDTNEAKEIEALSSELPESISIDGHSYQFGPVPKKDNSPKDYKPFNKAREVRCEASLADKKVTLHCRITSRKNGKWFFWLHIDPTQSASPNRNSIRLDGPSQPESFKAPDELSSILEIFDGT